jgi:ATP-dependent helicase IRC3
MQVDMCHKNLATGCGVVLRLVFMLNAHRVRGILLRDVRWYSATHAPIVLRPYQEACIQSCLDAIHAGQSRIGVSSPTGSGKTTVCSCTAFDLAISLTPSKMFVSLIDRLASPPERPEAKRSLIIVNSVELVRQTAESVRSLFPNLTVEVEQGQRNNASGYADVTVATYQTLLQPHRLNKFQPERMKAIIVDEAHHAAAPS